MLSLETFWKIWLTVGFPQKISTGCVFKSTRFTWYFFLLFIFSQQQCLPYSVAIWVEGGVYKYLGVFPSFVQEAPREK